MTDLQPSHLAAVPVADADGLTFFDPEQQLFGFLTPTTGAIYKAGELVAWSDGTNIESPKFLSWRGSMTSLKGSCDLQWEATSEPAVFKSSNEYVCSVKGTFEQSGAGPTTVSCLGTATVETRIAGQPGPPRLRSLSAVFDTQQAVFVHAYRPATYHGHGDEQVAGVLLEDGALVGCEEVRLSTIYDKNGRHRQASMELWLPDQEIPRRVAGEAVDGTESEVDPRAVNLSFFTWRTGAATGWGYYEIALSAPTPIAA